MQNKNASKIALLAAALITLVAITGVGYYFVSNRDSDADDLQETQQEQNNNSDEAEVFTIPVEIDGVATYQASAQEGDSAFDVLKNLSSNSDFTFEYDEYDFGVMINSIKDITPTSSQFWKFQVNGEDASVGVSDYKIKEGDSLKFVLDDIQF